MDVQTKANEFFDHFRENYDFTIDYENYKYEVERYIPINIPNTESKFRICIAENHEGRISGLEVFDEATCDWIVVPTLINVPSERISIFLRVSEEVRRKIE